MKHFNTRHKVAISLFALAGVVGLSAFESLESGTNRSPVPVSDFANFETPHVHPLDMTPDSTKLLAVNTANNSLEVYQISEDGLRHSRSIPVGMDPVTVRVRSNTEAWVVNRISDNISVVNLTTGFVERTLQTEDEPADVVFAGGKAFVTCSERKSVYVFTLSNLATPPTEVLLVGEQPRAMAVSLDGTKVYAAFFESGNQTTVIPGNEFMSQGFRSPQNGNGPGTIVDNDVAKPVGPYGGALPVPNAGAGFNPPLNPLLAVKTDMQSLVVRKNAAGQWMDDNGGNWTNLVSGGQGVRMAGWDLVDHDVAVIDVANPSTNTVTYQKHLGNILMAMAVNPATGRISVVGTDATNEIRFEPNLNGKFLRVNISQFLQGNQASTTITDLNPHLNYQTSSVAPALRTQSLGDPRGIAWKADGSQAFITGMGSNNVIVVDANGVRIGTDPIEVGEGPTGIKLHETRNRFYVLNKFDGSISTVDMTTGEETARTTFFDPTPEVIKKGRPHLYNTHTGSGTGHISCGSCHVDGRWDRLAWDLGDPSGEEVTVGGKTFHPMKGLKTTQWLLDIIDKGTGALHWRGDKETFQDFAGAFQHLQGLDAPADPVLMQEFSDFLAACYHGPNPYRHWWTSGAQGVPPRQLTRMNTGVNGSTYNRVRGPGTSFQTIRNAGVSLFVAVNVNCTHCHQMQTGRGDFEAQVGNENIGADLRTAHKKLGFYFNANSTAGFGFMADGAFETWVNQSGGLTHYFGDYQAEIMAWTGGVDTQNSPQSLTNGPGLQHEDNHSHPAIGLQHTINGSAIPNGTGDRPNNVDFLRTMADQFANVGLIVKGRWNGNARGFLYVGGGNYQPDANGAPLVSHDDLKAFAASNNSSALTWMLVHQHAAMRMGIDRDSDGTYDFLDGDAEVEVSAMLDGAYNGTAMSTHLVNMELLPTTDPYGFGTSLDERVLERTGPNAIVDWVFLELRDADDPTQTIDDIPALVQANGRIVTPAGSHPLVFRNAPRGNYHVVVKHRNHLGIMTAQSYLLGPEVREVDLRQPAVGTYGTDARRVRGPVMTMWSGDVVGNGLIRYTGAGNDRDPILQRVGGVVPTASVAGYHPEDLNLDGVVKYTGANNDRDVIILALPGGLITGTRVEQLP